MTPYGELLAHYRRDRRLSQRALGQALGVSAQAISAVESGRRRVLTPSQLETVRKALALSPSELQALRDAEPLSSYTVRIPPTASPQAIRAAHTFTQLLDRLTAPQLAEIQAHIDRIAAGEASEWRR